MSVVLRNYYLGITDVLHVPIDQCQTSTCCIILLPVQVCFSMVCSMRNNLTHIEADWCIYASINYANIVSDNSLSPGRRQAIIWTNTGLLSFEPLWTKFSAILVKIQFSFDKMHAKISSAKWLPFCLSLNVLNSNHIYRIQTLSSLCV